MYNEWSLDALYRGTDDPAIEEDLAALRALTEEYKTIAITPPADGIAAYIRHVLETDEKISVLVRKLNGYFHLRRSVNSADAEGAGYATQIRNIAASRTGAAVTSRNISRLLTVSMRSSHPIPCSPSTPSIFTGSKTPFPTR